MELKDEGKEEDKIDSDHEDYWRIKYAVDFLKHPISSNNWKTCGFF